MLNLSKRVVSALLLAGLGLSANAALDAASAVASDAISSALTTQYDVIIVGGGNTGLALAARLSDNPDISVLCVEAGPISTNNPGIIIPGLAGSTFFTNLDWAFFTQPQSSANNAAVYWPRGKVLGGSSALNFLVYTRGALAEYNAWATLIGSKAWSWTSLLPYFKKSETFTSTATNQLNVPVINQPSVHGTSGPVSTSYPSYFSPQAYGWYNALLNTGIPHLVDPDSGNNVGAAFIPSTQMPGSNNRSYAENAYYAPRSTRSNLVVVTNALVTKILWSSSASTPTATGVSFTSTTTNVTHTAKVCTGGQVVLSAGSVGTPQLLELSGVGNPTVLQPLGISTVVNLPGVGENLQDHPTATIVFQLAPGYESLDGISTNATKLNALLADYAQGKGLLTQFGYVASYHPPSQFLNTVDLATAQSLLVAPSSSPSISSSQLALTTQFFEAGIPFIEFIPGNEHIGTGTVVPGAQYFSMVAALQHSISRGNIHITSTNVLTHPAINPNYLQAQFDTFLLAKGLQFLRNLATNSALAPFLAGETTPGASVQTEADWESYVRSTVGTEYHPVGTASMLPRASGGVVDANLLVYGTTNLRVADMSILPLHVSSHLQSVAYAIAEKAATIIAGVL